MKTLWKIINLVTLSSIIVVIVYSEAITSQINGYRELLNSVSHDKLSDAEHMFRLIINKWEGIALAFTLSFIFLIRELWRRFLGVANKLTSKK